MKSQIKEGKEYFIWMKRENKKTLFLATLYSCDKCGKASAVNAFEVVNSQSSMSDKGRADAIECLCGEITELGGVNEEGDCHCEVCA